MTATVEITILKQEIERLKERSSLLEALVDELKSPPKAAPKKAAPRKARTKK